MKYFISCSTADHGKIKALDDLLTGIGHSCMLRWWDTAYGKGEEAFELAFKRTQAAENSELFICLLPLTQTASIELGTALASRYGKRIILWSATGREFDPEYAGVFFMHPSVTRLGCSFPELLDYLKTL